eukprot:2578521-Rhodomonas_salina.2
MRALVAMCRRKNKGTRKKLTRLGVRGVPEVAVVGVVRHAEVAVKCGLAVVVKRLEPRLRALGGVKLLDGLELHEKENKHSQKSLVSANEHVFGCAAIKQVLLSLVKCKSAPRFVLCWRQPQPCESNVRLYIAWSGLAA